jgi:hypothetical protein
MFSLSFFTVKNNDAGEISIAKSLHLSEVSVNWIPVLFSSKYILRAG